MSKYCLYKREICDLLKKYCNGVFIEVFAALLSHDMAPENAYLMAVSVAKQARETEKIKHGCTMVNNACSAEYKGIYFCLLYESSLFGTLRFGFSVEDEKDCWVIFEDNDKNFIKKLAEVTGEQDT